MAKKSPVDFMEQYILDVLRQSGLDNLSDASKQVYLPQLMAEAQQRIGLVLMTKLDEKQADKFVKMTENSEMYSWEQWQQFWKNAVPNYEQLVRETLDKFGEDCKTILKRNQ